MILASKTTFLQIVQFKKKSIPTLRKVIGNSLGEGVLKVKILEANYEAKLEFPRGSRDIFWTCTLHVAVNYNL